jgi:hypothetical protein
MGELFTAPHIIFLLFFFIPIALFTYLVYLAIRFLSRSPKVEREAYYHAEVIKKIAESGAGSAPAIEYLREQERIKAAKWLGGLKLGGLINIAVGLGMMIFLWTLTHGAPCAVGTIPLLVGLAMLAYAFWLAPERTAETK